MTLTCNTSRRGFLRRSAAAGAALAGGLWIGRSAHAAGEDTLKVALVGCGVRGTGAAANCLNVKDKIKLVAVADVFPERARGAQESLRNQYGDKVDVPDDRVFVGFDAFQKALACGVDLVILAAPPGFRPQQYRAAVEAGKHVFMERPCCVDAAGFRMLMEANSLADRRGLKVGVGLERRHAPNYGETVQRIHDGAVGLVRWLQACSNQGSPWTPGRRQGDTEMAFQLRNWRYFTCFGGDHIVYQHVDNLDVANWVKNDHPIEANGTGGRQRRDELPEVGDVYDHHFVEFTYADGAKLFSQCRQMDDCWGNVSEFAHGLKGSADCAGSITGQSPWSYNATGPRLSPFDQELVDLIRAIRNNEKYHEGWHGATSSMTAVLGRMATYSGQVVRWDEAVAKGPDIFPKDLAWEAKPPIVPDAKGSYRHAAAAPGVYRPY